MFQSQTGSPSSSDLVLLPLTPCTLNSFNPKREAHPLQTGRSSVVSSVKSLPFQSQTGSPSSSDWWSMIVASARAKSFNPKREAHPLQTAELPVLPVHQIRFNPKREAHPLQTKSGFLLFLLSPLVSIPNGKPILFRPGRVRSAGRHGRPGVSIPNGKPILFRLCHKIDGCARTKS